jgi:hypothetical protein
MSEDLGAKLGRWSQRKHAARSGVVADDGEPQGGRDEGTVARTGEPPAAATSGMEQSAEPNAAATDNETPKLPPIDELTADSDYTVFLAENVPEAIRRAALRKLWRSDPVFANLDRLNDYDEDYSFVETIATAVRTSYQVGKGYVDEAEKKLAELESTHSDKDGADERHEQTAEEDVAAHATGDGVVVYNDAAGDNAAAAARQNDRSEPDCPSDGQLPDKDN